MSADAILVCPKCLKNTVEQLSTAIKDLEDSYANIPIKEYNQKKDKVESLIDKVANPDKNLLEYYEISINTRGNFFVSYGCRCEVCNFQFSFTHLQNVLPEDK